MRKLDYYLLAVVAVLSGLVAMTTVLFVYPYLTGGKDKTGKGMEPAAATLTAVAAPAGQAPAPKPATPATPAPLAAPAAPAGDRIPATSSTSFGSLTLLNRLWTLDQLKGKPGERAIDRPRDDGKPRYPKDLMPKTHWAPLPAGLKGSIRSVKTSEKLLALTFDLCERGNEMTGYDGAIFDYLRSRRVPATMYIGGKYMRSHPDRTLQLMADPLFEIGNHAWTHGNFGVITGDTMREQVLYTQGEYERLWNELARRAAEAGLADEMKLVPRLPLTFRFPFGTCTPAVLSYLAGEGLPAIQWDVVTGDPAKGQTAQAIAAIVLNKAHPGAIIICHGNGRGIATADALDLFIPKLRDQGYRFVTVTQLLQAGTAVAPAECYENRPGDNTVYNTKFGDALE